MVLKLLANALGARNREITAPASTAEETRMSHQTRYLEPEAISMLDMNMSAIDSELITLDEKPSEKFRRTIARRIIDAAMGGETDPIRIKQFALGNTANEQSHVAKLQPFTRALSNPWARWPLASMPWPNRATAPV